MEREVYFREKCDTATKKDNIFEKKKKKHYSHI